MGSYTERLNMSPEEVNESLKNLFSNDGLELNGIKIKAESPLIINIYHEGNRTTINFGSNNPKAEIKRFITFRAYIEGLCFKEHGGSIKLKNFPDLNFSYGKNSLLDLFTQNFCHSFGIDGEIEKKYRDNNKKEIAKKCLQYAEEWAKISQHSVDFASANSFERYELRRNCYEFIRSNIEEEAREKYGSVFLTFILLYVILPAIISWVVHKMLDKLFTK